MTDSNVLNFTQKETIPYYSCAEQVDDGTMFYYKFYDEAGSGKQRLFVKYQGKEIEAELPAFNYSSIYASLAVNGNVLYFVVKRKVYNVTFTPPCHFAFSLLGQRIHLNGSSSTAQWEGRSMEDKENETSAVICRWWDLQGHPVGIPDDLLDDPRCKGIKWTHVQTVHRGKAIYTKCDTDIENPVVHKLTEDIILLEIPSSPTLIAKKVCRVTFVRDSCPFIYMAWGTKFYTLNTETMKFLQTLTIEGIGRNDKINGVYNGAITMQKENFLMSAQLPEGFFRNYDEATQKKAEKIEEVEAAEKRKPSEKEELKGNVAKKRKTNK